MTSRLTAFARFWYDFVVGDDWRVAVAVIAALALTHAVSTTVRARVADTACHRGGGASADCVAGGPPSIIQPVSQPKVNRRRSLLRVF